MVCAGPDLLRQVAQSHRVATFPFQFGARETHCCSRAVATPIAPSKEDVKGRAHGPVEMNGEDSLLQLRCLLAHCWGASCKSVRAVEVESFGLRQWGVAHLQAVSHCQPNKLTRAICSSVDVP